MEIKLEDYDLENYNIFSIPIISSENKSYLSVAVTLFTSTIRMVIPSPYHTVFTARSFGLWRADASTSVRITNMSRLLTRKTFCNDLSFISKTIIFQFYSQVLILKTVMIGNSNVVSLLVQPLGENPQNPARHASQFRPPTPGLQEH